MRICPKCSYDLTGLPTGRLCPECGFASDDHAIVIDLDANAHDKQQLWYGVLLLVMFGLGAYSTGLSAGYGLFAIVGFCMGISVVRMLLRSTDQGRLLLNHVGVEVERPGRGPIVTTWREIREARYTFPGGKCVLLNQDGKRLLALTPRDIGGRDMTRKCVDEINSHARLYADSEWKPV